MGGWILHVAFIKLLKRFVQILVAWIIGHNLARFGISIDPIQLSAAIWASLETVRNYLKINFKLSWL